MKILSYEHKKAISEGLKKSYLIGKRKNIGKKISIALTGKKMKEETKQKLREINLGKKASEETKKKMSDTRKRIGHRPPIISGEKSHLWKDGRSYNPAWVSYSKRKNLYLRENAIGNFTKEDWKEMLKEYNWKCLSCGRGGFLTIDHIIPLSKGGTNDKENIQPLCQSCNSKKHTKIINYKLIHSMGKNINTVNIRGLYI